VCYRKGVLKPAVFFKFSQIVPTSPDDPPSSDPKTVIGELGRQRLMTKKREQVFVSLRKQSCSPPSAPLSLSSVH